jgi:serine/threonine-protein kinase
MIAPASRKIGKYEIRRKLGRGGMADVYLAQDTESGQTVALKLIEHSADADTSASIEAEMRGATLQARLADIDPRVVRVFGAGDLEGFFHVAMEYVDGQDLAELMRHGKLEVEFSVDVALAVAQTLENAHKLEMSLGGKEIRGIVHGDIKPKNIRIDAHGNVRVLDFGIAKALSMSRKLTRNEFGSVPYASPERLESGEVNVGSDLWSLAVMLYEMVTGLRPYEADSTERMERMIRSGIAPPPAPDPCPEALRCILMKAMAPDPDVRYPSAEALGTELAAFRAGGKVQVLDEDLEATRRTFRRPLEVAEETRRTSGDETRRTVEPAPVTAPKPGPAATKPRGEAYYWMMRAALIGGLAFVGWGAWATVSSVRLYQHGQAFERDVASEQLTDPNQIWDRWAELSKDNPSSLLLRGPRAVAREKFIAAADRVIATYRINGSDLPYDTWHMAQTMLLHALSTEPDDKAVHGKLRLCEGHISVVTRKNEAGLNDAVRQYQEAQQAMPQSPDPPVALARLNLYLLGDADKAAAEFHSAETAGYETSGRERSKLADLYRDKGNQAWKAAYSVYGQSGEKELIQQSADFYGQALTWYQKSGGWGNSASRISEMQADLESAHTRLQQIDQEQSAPDPAAVRRNVIGGLLRGLANAFRDKSTKKDSGH